MIEPHRKNETVPCGMLQKVTQGALSENKLWQCMYLLLGIIIGHTWSIWMKVCSRAIVSTKIGKFLLLHYIMI